MPRRTVFRHSQRAAAIVYQCLDLISPRLAQWFGRAVHRARTVVSTPHGVFWIDPMSVFGNSITAGVPDPQTTKAIEMYLSPGSVFVDVGANEGYFTVQAAKVCGPAGRVYAIEPQPRCCAVLETNCRLNGATNVKILPVAVSDHSGRLTLHLHAVTNPGATSIVRPGRSSWRQLTVDCMPLERLLDSEGVGSVDLLKMDIEGAEYEAILGSPAMFRSGRIRSIALEYHPDILDRRGLRSAEIHHFLLDCGYELDPVLNAPPSPEIEAFRATYRRTVAGAAAGVT